MHTIIQYSNNLYLCPPVQPEAARLGEPVHLDGEPRPEPEPTMAPQLLPRATAESSYVHTFGFGFEPIPRRGAVNA